MAIVSYKGKFAADIAGGSVPKGFLADILRSAQRKLTMLNYAVALEDLRSPPENRLERL